MRSSLLVALAIPVSSLSSFPAEAKQPRSSVERHAFVKENACPATDRARLPCSGYHVDHIVPLCAGGADHRSNMQWLTIEDHKAKTKIDVRACNAKGR